jgi:Transposase zinc-ribbon domain
VAEDYPRTLGELERRFSDDAACRQYLFALRWPEGFRCPRCQREGAWQISRGLWLCRGCRTQVSVLAGTVFQDTHLPLTVWFRDRRIRPSPGTPTPSQARGASASKSPPGGFPAQAMDTRNTPRSGPHQHLDDYLNEFVFRFNRRKSASRGKLTTITERPDSAGQSDPRKATNLTSIGTC